MGQSLISMLKPNFLDKSEVKDNIFIIKKVSCSKKTDFFLKISSLEKKFFELIAHKKSRIEKELLSKLNIGKELSILIISFPTSSILDPILECKDRNLSIVGIDISLNKLRKVQKYYKDKIDISLVECCAQNLPFNSKQFDLVINIGSFNNFKNKIATVKEMIRVAKNSSNILISDKVKINTVLMLKNLEKELLKLNVDYEISSVLNDKYYTIKINNY